MNNRLGEQAVIATGVAYLIVLAWSIANLSYDIWGAFVVAPVLLIVGVAMLRRMFRGSQAQLLDVMVLGMVAKLAGGIARYWVSFDVYGGATDAQRYHTYASRAASEVWDGTVQWSSALPHGTGTEFLERFTAVIYTVSGSSRMGAFLVFAWIAFLGVALFVKAAVIAVPGLARRHYALFVVLAPSVLFWSSSIGKEAYMFLTLGIGTFGISRLMSRPGIVVSGLITVAGLGAAIFVRPHIVGVWLAGTFPGLLVAVVRGRSGAIKSTGRRGGDIVALLLLIVVAVVGLSVVSQATVDYFNPGSDEVLSTSISDILAETTRRTSESGSTFVPPAVNSPTDWPYASLRTLTRPLPIEARGLGQSLVAAELLAFFGLCVIYWKRVTNLPRTLVTNPFVAFAITTLFLAGLAYSSFANLGVLTRQKSLIFPFLLLIPCLPEGKPAVRRRVTPDQNSSTSPNESDQLASGGTPSWLTPRQVSTGPPPGREIDPDDIWA